MRIESNRKYSGTGGHKWLWVDENPENASTYYDGVET